MWWRRSLSRCFHETIIAEDRDEDRHNRLNLSPLLETQKREEVEQTSVVRSVSLVVHPVEVSSGLLSNSGWWGRSLLRLVRHTGVCTRCVRR